MDFHMIWKVAACFADPIVSSHRSNSPYTTDSWRFFAGLLEPKMALLEVAFDPANFPDTRRKLRLYPDQIPAVKS
jgi:hypothetical protein